MCSAMAWRSNSLRFWLNKWPGKRLFGVYRYLPIFFCLGAALEFSMINWNAGAGDTNFYRTYKKRRAHELAVQQLGVP